MGQNAVSEPVHAIPRVVLPLVRRHVEDVAFYWQQIDASASSTRLTWDRLRHFDRLLQANLEGAHRAGDTGMQVAREALGRWRSAGEVFVSASLVLRHEDDDAMVCLLDVVRDAPDATMRGLVSAFGRMQTPASCALVLRWLQDSDPILKVAALRVVALGRPVADMPVSLILPSLEHDDCHVRAAACRAVGRLDRGAAQLAERLQDEDLATSAEAAIALQEADVLKQCIAAQSDLAHRATGWYRSQALRRLRRWVRQMAWTLPWPAETDLDWLAGLPPRAALEYVAHRGDTRLEPWLVRALEQTPFPRYAGWAWQVLRGVDIEGAGLVISELPVDPEENVIAVTEDDDGGAMPDVQAIRRWVDHAGPAWHGERVILGQRWSTAVLWEVLAEGAQVYRAMAAQALADQTGHLTLNVRAPAREQDVVIEKLRRSGQHASI